MGAAAQTTLQTVARQLERGAGAPSNVFTSILYAQAKRNMGAQEVCQLLGLKHDRLVRCDVPVFAAALDGGTALFTAAEHTAAREREVRRAQGAGLSPTQVQAWVAQAVQAHRAHRRGHYDRYLARDVSEEADGALLGLVPLLQQFDLKDMDPAPDGRVQVVARGRAAAQGLRVVIIRPNLDTVPPIDRNYARRAMFNLIYWRCHCGTRENAFRDVELPASVHLPVFRASNRGDPEDHDPAPPCDGRARGAAGADDDEACNNPATPGNAQDQAGAARDADDDGGDGSPLTTKQALWLWFRWLHSDEPGAADFPCHDLEVSQVRRALAFHTWHGWHPTAEHYKNHADRDDRPFERYDNQQQAAEDEAMERDEEGQLRRRPGAGGAMSAAAAAAAAADGLDPDRVHIDAAERLRMERHDWTTPSPACPWQGALEQDQRAALGGWLESAKARARATSGDSTGRQVPAVQREQLNEHQRFVFDAVDAHDKLQSAGEAVPPLRLMVLGSAGTGKTFLINALATKLGDRLLRTATTGKAATNIAGHTLHSAFKIPCTQREARDWEDDAGHLRTNQSRARQLAEKLRGVSYVVVDELSMLGLSAWECLDRRAQQVAGVRDTLGGTKLHWIIFGDLGQLPAVKDGQVYADAAEVQRRAAYRRGWNVFNTFRDVVFLSQVMRQAGEEQAAMRTCLSHWHAGYVTQDDFALLRTRFRDTLEGTAAGRAELTEFQSQATHLFASRREVQAHNHRALRSVDAPLALIQAENSGSGAANARDSDVRQLAKELLLKVGARVMVQWNLWVDAGIVNGSTGTVVDIVYTGSHRPPDLPDCVCIQLDDDGTYTGPSAWPDTPRVVAVPPCETSWQVREDTCSRRQLPLMLAHALTIHKSQGQTLRRVCIDLGDRETHDGSSYTAASRARRLQDIVFRPFPMDRISRLWTRKATRQRAELDAYLRQLAAAPPCLDTVRRAGRLDCIETPRRGDGTPLALAAPCPPVRARHPDAPTPDFRACLQQRSTPLLDTGMRVGRVRRYDECAQPVTAGFRGPQQPSVASATSSRAPPTPAYRSSASAVTATTPRARPGPQTFSWLYVPIAAAACGHDHGGLPALRNAMGHQLFDGIVGHYRDVFQRQGTEPPFMFDTAPRRIAGAPPTGGVVGYLAAHEQERWLLPPLLPGHNGNPHVDPVVYAQLAEWGATHLPTQPPPAPGPSGRQRPPASNTSRSTRRRLAPAGAALS